MGRNQGGRSVARLVAHFMYAAGHNLRPMGHKTGWNDHWNTVAESAGYLRVVNLDQDWAIDCKLYIVFVIYNVRNIHLVFFLFLSF